MASKKYSGRLSFDPDSGFHLGEDGKKVVTLDQGKTWQYATPQDTSHIERYQERVVGVDTTVNATDPEPHHYEVQADDPHFAGVRSDPDAAAPTLTSHTEAYKDGGA